ncbi:MAG: hypothetical protein Q8R40_00695 [bacterium]|nr:hypothetical protein [bacterium]
MNTDDLIKLATNKDLHNVLKGPLGGPLWHFLEVFLSDLSVRLGIDALQYLVKPRTPADPATTEAGGITTAVYPRIPPALKLLEIFLTLERDKRTEIAGWFKEIENKDKQKLGLVSEETLKALLALSPDERVEALSILEDQSLEETITKAIKKFDDFGPEMPKTAEVLQQFGDWGRSVDIPGMDEPDVIRKTVETVFAYLRKLLLKIMVCLATSVRDGTMAVLHAIGNLPMNLFNAFRRISRLGQDICRYSYIRYMGTRTFLSHTTHVCLNYVRNLLRLRKP